ncbi:MAG: class I SAM-dependent methyltransferase [Candidatus Omnitrophica bacterium]|nr:class I SAM-dependent methyltransferase [Candidatus Omnitrophota bacterium]
MIKWDKRVWDRIFKKEGKLFIAIHKDIPKIVKIFKKKNVKRILDLGCGTGRHLIYLAKHNFDMYGIDISEYGIKITDKCLKEKNLKACLKVGDIYKKLPYKDNFFDAIISIKTIHHGKIENIRKLIKEMERILKPHGLIFITVSKRKFKKEIPKEKLWKIKFIAPRTFIPLTGKEKGLVHFWFNKKLLKKEFRNFKIHKIWVDSEAGYTLLGELKKK